MCLLVRWMGKQVLLEYASALRPKYTEQGPHESPRGPSKVIANAYI